MIEIKVRDAFQVTGPRDRPGEHGRVTLPRDRRRITAGFTTKTSVCLISIKSTAQLQRSTRDVDHVGPRGITVPVTRKA
jgi:hypothetical protein